MSTLVVSPEKLSAIDKTMVVDASEVAIAHGKDSNGKDSNGDRKVPMVEFVSGDGKSFFVEEKVARKFKPKKEITEQVLEGGECTRVLGIHSELLTIMINWAVHHVDDPETATTSSDVVDNEVKRVDDIDEWDKKLLDLKVETLFRLTNAVSRDVHVDGLLNVLYKKLASLLKGKTSDEMREVFNLPKIEKEAL